MVVLVAACGDKAELSAEDRAALDFLANAEKVELVSIESDWRDTSFHGYRELGRTTLDPTTAARLVSAFRGVVDPGGDPPRCFVPHDALIATRGGRSLTFLICFHCYKYQVWEGDAPIAGSALGKKLEQEFDAAFTAAKVPLPPRRAATPP